ncbi:hypothetical protein AGDE_16402 [Angomonas deanei]|nr:hypothetical protein AGDE_16402 [Angomonas deanei]|eukprot:EPY17153.1 hypothetical protein AGDE_16402 [Angomonas deanei]
MGLLTTARPYVYCWLMWIARYYDLPVMWVHLLCGPSVLNIFAQSIWYGEVRTPDTTAKFSDLNWPKLLVDLVLAGYTIAIAAHVFQYRWDQFIHYPPPDTTAATRHRAKLWEESKIKWVHATITHWAELARDRRIFPSWLLEIQLGLAAAWLSGGVFGALIFGVIALYLYEPVRPFMPTILVTAPRDNSLKQVQAEPVPRGRAIRRRRFKRERLWTGKSVCGSFTVLFSPYTPFLQVELFRAIHLFLGPFLVGVACHAATVEYVSWTLRLGSAVFFTGTPPSPLPWFVLTAAQTAWREGAIKGCVALFLSVRGGVQFFFSLELIEVFFYFLVGSFILWFLCYCICPRIVAMVVRPGVLFSYTGLAAVSPERNLYPPIQLLAYWRLIKTNHKKNMNNSSSFHWWKDTLLALLPTELFRAWFRTLLCYSMLVCLMAAYGAVTRVWTYLPRSSYYHYSTGILIMWRRPWVSRTAPALRWSLWNTFHHADLLLQPLLGGVLTGSGGLGWAVRKGMALPLTVVFYARHRLANLCVLLDSLPLYGLVAVLVCLTLSQRVWLREYYFFHRALHHAAVRTSAVVTKLCRLLGLRSCGRWRVYHPFLSQCYREDFLNLSAAKDRELGVVLATFALPWRYYGRVDFSPLPCEVTVTRAHVIGRNPVSVQLAVTKQRAKRRNHIKEVIKTYRLEKEKEKKKKRGGPPHSVPSTGGKGRLHHLKFKTRFPLRHRLRCCWREVSHFVKTAFLCAFALHFAVLYVALPFFLSAGLFYGVTSCVWLILPIAVLTTTVCTSLSVAFGVAWIVASLCVLRLAHLATSLYTVCRGCLRAVQRDEKVTKDLIDVSSPPKSMVGSYAEKKQMKREMKKALKAEKADP